MYLEVCTPSTCKACAVIHKCKLRKNKAGWFGVGCVCVWWWCGGICYVINLLNVCHFLHCRVFGHFEKPLFLELCRNVETKFIPAGAYLFKRGQPDDCIFVVQSGRLVVFITEPVS